MERYTPFLFLMISVLVLVIVMTYNSAFCKKTQLSDHPAEEFGDNKDANSMLTTRVSDVIYAMHELTVNPIVNQGDVNTMYQIWYSAMNKRGIPSYYVTPELFTELRTQIVRGDLTPESVESAILPYYQREVAVLRNPTKPKPFEPVCLNY